MADGFSPEESAVKLGLSRAGLYRRLQAAREQIGADSNAVLVAECYERGWLATRPVRLEHDEEAGEWPKITAAQRLYLDVFDRMLKTRFGSEEERRARLEMRYMLGAMRIEQRISVPGEKREPERPVLALAA